MTSSTFSVRQINGEYWSDMAECGVFGPYGSLRESLTDESCEVGDMVQLTGVSSSIWCSELSAEEIVKLLKTDYLDYRDERLPVSINDQVWCVDESGRLKKVEDEETNRPHLLDGEDEEPNSSLEDE